MEQLSSNNTSLKIIILILTNLVLLLLGMSLLTLLYASNSNLFIYIYLIYIYSNIPAYGILRDSSFIQLVADKLHITIVIKGEHLDSHKSFSCNGSPHKTITLFHSKDRLWFAVHKCAIFDYVDSSISRKAFRLSLTSLNYSLNNISNNISNNIYNNLSNIQSPTFSSLPDSFFTDDLPSLEYFLSEFIDKLLDLSDLYIRQLYDSLKITLPYILTYIRIL